MNLWTTADPATRAIEQVSTNLFDPAVSVIGPSSAQSPLVFSFAHSGRNYPSDFLKRTKLSLQNLRRSEDAYVDQLFPAIALTNACFVTALFPRTWVDANRDPNSLDPNMFLEALPEHEAQHSSQVSAGFGVIPKVSGQDHPIYTHRLSVSEAIRRIETAHIPYHQELGLRLALAKERYGFAILIDCHSMPGLCQALTPTGNGQIVLGDLYGTSCDPKLRESLLAAFREQGFIVAHNQPYAGGYSVQHYGDPAFGIHAIQIEIARNLYMNEETFKKLDEFSAISNRLVQVMADLDKFARSFVP